ncbi:hypothetical protein TOPH_08027, partial [Tolypocladium ophioglossoides CBS 100239]
MTALLESTAVELWGVAILVGSRSESSAKVIDDAEIAGDPDLLDSAMDQLSRPDGTNPAPSDRAPSPSTGSAPPRHPSTQLDPVLSLDDKRCCVSMRTLPVNTISSPRATPYILRNGNDQAQCYHISAINSTAIPRTVILVDLGGAIRSSPGQMSTTGSGYPALGQRSPNDDFQQHRVAGDIPPPTSPPSSLPRGGDNALHAGTEGLSRPVVARCEEWPLCDAVLKCFTWATSYNAYVSQDQRAIKHHRPSKQDRNRRLTAREERSKQHTENILEQPSRPDDTNQDADVHQTDFSLA